MYERFGSTLEIPRIFITLLVFYQSLAGGVKSSAFFAQDGETFHELDIARRCKASGRQIDQMTQFNEA